MSKYRNNGAIGALLDEYERVVSELQTVIQNISPEQLTHIVDKQTKDPSCKSIQTILTHVIQSGYWFAVEVRKFYGEKIDFPKATTFNSSKAYQLELDKMFKYNEQLFDEYPVIKIDETENQKKIKVLWGQTYNTEQLFEHAIVHVSRHRRQIERFLQKL